MKKYNFFFFSDNYLYFVLKKKQIISTILSKYFIFFIEKKKCKSFILDNYISICSIPQKKSARLKTFFLTNIGNILNLKIQVLKNKHISFLTLKKQKIYFKKNFIKQKLIFPNSLNHFKFKVIKRFRNSFLIYYNYIFGLIFKKDFWNYYLGNIELICVKIKIIYYLQKKRQRKYKIQKCFSLKITKLKTKKFYKKKLYNKKPYLYFIKKKYKKKNHKLRFLNKKKIFNGRRKKIFYKITYWFKKIENY